MNVENTSTQDTLLLDSFIKSIKDELKAKVLKAIDSEIDSAIESVVRELNAEIISSYDTRKNSMVCNLIIRKNDA